jgi:hypothetical protein
MIATAGAGRTSGKGADMTAYVAELRTFAEALVRLAEDAEVEHLTSHEARGAERLLLTRRLHLLNRRLARSAQASVGPLP